MKIILKIIKILLNVFFIIWLFINSVLILNAIFNPNNAPNFFIFKPYVVISESNETDMNYGDFVIAKKSEKLKENDIVVVKSTNRKATTYRIDKIEEDNLKLENESNTKIIISKKSIEGKCIIKLKGMGKIALLFRKPVVAVISLLLGIIIGFIIYRIKLLF